MAALFFAEKALFVQTSVWPLALYSSDTTYIGQNNFTKLRRAVLNALIGDWHTGSSFACYNSISQVMVDPFLYALCQCARILRSLATVAPERANETVSKMVHYSGSRPYGPATAFKQYLSVVDWSIDCHGNVIGPDHMQCNVLTDSTRKIVNTFKAMWIHHVIASMDRKGVGDFIPDNRLAMRVFFEVLGL